MKGILRVLRDITQDWITTNGCYVEAVLVEAVLTWYPCVVMEKVNDNENVRRLSDMNCTVMIWRSWVQTPVGSNFGKIQCTFAASDIHTSAFFLTCCTHHYCVIKDGKEWESYLTLQHVTVSGNIWNPTPWSQLSFGINNIIKLQEAEFMIRIRIRIRIHLLARRNLLYTWQYSN